MICSYCGIELTEENRTKDHIFPRSWGGRGHGNLVWSCMPCNTLKSDRLVSPITPQYVRKYTEKAFKSAKKNLNGKLRGYPLPL